MIEFELLHPAIGYDILGFLPNFLSLDDPRSAREQLDFHYSFAGGYRPFQGHTLGDDNSLKYPGDPPLVPLAQAKLRNELVVYYRHSWVAIIQRDRSYVVARMD